MCNAAARMHEFWRVWDLMPGMHHMQSALRPSV
jgi:hypothetical protein